MVSDGHRRVEMQGCKGRIKEGRDAVRRQERKEGKRGEEHVFGRLIPKHGVDKDAPPEIPNR
eukprot:122339-Rhodomonas_salina.2